MPRVFWLGGRAVRRATAPSRRRVLVAHPSAELYGSDRMLLESVRALSTEWDVHVVLARGGPLVDACRAAGARVDVLAVPVLHKGMLNLPGVLRFLRDGVAGLLTGRRLVIADRPDLIYVNTVTVPLWLLIARSVGVPAICHVHEAEAAIPQVARWILAVPLRLARVIVANSAAARDVLIRSDRRLCGRVQVLHNGVPGPARQVTPLRERLDGDVRLLLVGRLSHRKGTDVAITAAHFLDERGLAVRLVLAGSCATGYASFADGLRDRVERLGLSDRVTFCGFVTDVWRLHDEADVVLVPSRFEPFGNVAVEAMLAGRPVIAADVQGLVEIVRDGDCGLVVPAGDAAVLADAVERLVRDWPAARELALRGRAQAGERFGVDRYARQLRELVSVAAATRAPVGVG